MKRLILSAILAVMFHGLLLGIELPSQIRLPPKPAAIPVQIAIRRPSATPVKIEPQSPPQPRQQGPIAQAPPKAGKPVAQKKKAAKKSAVLAPIKKESTIRKISKEQPPAPPPLSPAEGKPAANPPQERPSAEEQETVRKSERAPELAPSAPEKRVERILAVPAYQHNQQPDYPARARRRGYGGTVMLKVLVDAAGRVADLAVDQSSGHRILDEAALQAVQNWLFNPATENGVPVTMWVSVPITFQLQEP